MVVDISQFIVVLTYIFQQAPKNKYFTAYCPFNLHISRGHLKVNILQLIVVLTHIFMYLYLMLNLACRNWPYLMGVSCSDGRRI